MSRDTVALSPDDRNARIMAASEAQVALNRERELHDLGLDQRHIGTVQGIGYYAAQDILEAMRAQQEKLPDA